MRNLVLLFFVSTFAACSSPPPPPKPVAVEHIPPPPEAEKKKLTLKVGGSGTAYAVDAVSVEGDANMLRVFGEGGNFTVIGRALGKTVLRFVAKDGHTESLDVEIVAGDPATRTLIVGETFTLPMTGVKEYSIGLPDIVGANITGNGGLLVITGKKQGTTTILLLGKNGRQTSHEVAVVGGKRWF